MSGESSSAVEWFTRLEPAIGYRLPATGQGPAATGQGPADDPRLGDIIESWQGDQSSLGPGRGVILGFPQDEGVRRNHGRPGTAEAPNEIRRWLYRLSTWDGDSGMDLADAPPLDAGNVRIEGTLEESQQALGEVVGGILRGGAVPIVLGGGHETAYGHYVGYLAAGIQVGIINVDAHLDVRPLLDGLGHSGSPFSQALEHSTHPLPGARYVCLGAQPHTTSKQHRKYAQERGCVIRWRHELQPSLAHHLVREVDRLAADGCRAYLSIDADAVQMADVPGVSAPNPVGLTGQEVIAAVRLAGQLPPVSSLDLVEINPRFDRDGQSARWGALLIWNFLIGLSSRPNFTTETQRSQREKTS